MLYALLLQEESVWVRHECATSGCDHGPWPDSAGWAAAGSAHRKRNSIFDVPRDAVAFTCYGTPGRHFEHTTSGLVLKSVLAGREEFAVDGGMHCVTEGEVLVMNGGRRYGSLAVAEQAAMHTYCVEFGEAFVAEVLYSLQSKVSDEVAPALSPEVWETNYVLSRPLWRRGWLAGIPSALELEETGYSLLEQVFMGQAGETSRARALSIVDAALRRATLQRLLRARDTIRATLDGTLAQWAAVACMSRFHFLRLFRQVFSMTPHQYLIELRLQKARAELRRSQRSILEVALECGFKDASQFAHSFRRRFGCSPRQWRDGT